MVNLMNDTLWWSVKYFLNSVDKNYICINLSGMFSVYGKFTRRKKLMNLKELNIYRLGSIRMTSTHTHNKETVLQEIKVITKINQRNVS